MNQDRMRQWLERLNAHHPGEGAHGERVAVYAVATADRLGWNEDALQDLRFAAALHDIGKLGVSEAMLGASRPTGADVLILRTHAATGAELLFDELSHRATEWIATHHERWDGYGYPHGLAGADIPVGGRVIAVAETFDVLLHDGRWRTTLSEEAALDEVRRCAGTQFDPEVVEAFLAVQPLIQPLRDHN